MRRAFRPNGPRGRARDGAACAFPPRSGYGTAVVGAGPPRPGSGGAADALDALRLGPPVFMPRRLEKLIDLGREPLYSDVDLSTPIGGFRRSLPLYISALRLHPVASDRPRRGGRRPGRAGSASRW
jgi:hypothetical protein